MSSLRAQQGYELYRTIKTTTVEDPLDSDFVADVPDKVDVYSMDEIVCQPFFETASQVVVLEPHWYDKEDNLLTIGSPMTFTAHATSTATKVLETGEDAVAAFPAVFDYCINPGAHGMRLKATTIPVGDVGVYVGKRA